MNVNQKIVFPVIYIKPAKCNDITMYGEKDQNLYEKELNL